MSFKPSFFSVLLMITLAQSPFSNAQAQDQAQQKIWFPKKDLITVGVYYYPEQWPENQWERDFKNMKKMGFEFTHFAEFAWAQLEPEEGKYQFEWLDKAVRMAEKHGIKVIMCTPTPTPPAWMSQKYPDILAMRENGRTLQHGARQHISWSSKTYREKCKVIVEKMAQRYGNDPNVMGWQLDNEPSHYGPYDISPAVVGRFQEWLKNKYVHIDSLNTHWGTSFWSVHYNNFGQIPIPNQFETVQGVNPHAQLDFKRFSADECASFLAEHATIIRQYTLSKTGSKMETKIGTNNTSKPEKKTKPKTESKIGNETVLENTSQQWITTNFMSMHGGTDPWRSKYLDFISYTLYPASTGTDSKSEEGFRRGTYWHVPYAVDMFRPLKQTTGVMELQIGQVNWGAFQPRMAPGTVRSYLWHSFAAGSDFSCSYRFRQPIFGYEMYIEGMVGPDGFTPTEGGKEYVQTMEEIRKLRQAYDPKTKEPSLWKQRKTAIVWSHDNMWDVDYQKQTNQWNTYKHVFENYYHNLKSLAIPIDFIDPYAALDTYKVLVVPAHQLVDAKMIAQWKAFVQAGGHLVISCRTGHKKMDGRLWEAAWAQPIHELIGAKIDFYDNLPASKTGYIDLDGKKYPWNNWSEVLSPFAGTEIWGNHVNGFYKGKPAITHHNYGKGSVTYIGTDSDDGALEKAILKKVYQKAGIATEDLPEGVFIEYQKGFWVAVNYGETSFTLPCPAQQKMLLGDTRLDPLEVSIWKAE